MGAETAPEESCIKFIVSCYKESGVGVFGSPVSTEDPWEQLGVGLDVFTRSITPKSS